VDLGRRAIPVPFGRGALIAAALAVGVGLLRLPFVSHELWAWDSVLYARAIEQGFHVDYDLSVQRPHPPGYLLYVATAALLRLLVVDTNLALVLLSVVAGALATATIFQFARRLASEPAALIAAVGFALNPLVWTYSEVAYPYTVLALGSTAVAATCHGARRTAGLVLVMSAIFGLAAGFRQDLLLLVGPLWVWTVAQHRWRIRAAAFLALAITSTSWLVPTLLLSEGPQAYFFALLNQVEFVGRTYSVSEHGLAALAANVGTTAYALAWGTLLFTALAPLGFAARDTRTLLLTWTLPAVIFYSFVHIGEWGYVLSVLPAVYVASAVGCDRAIVALRVRRGVIPLVTIGAAILPAIVFLLAQTTFSASAIELHDRELAYRVRYVRANFSPRETAVLAREDFLLVRYYLPEYRAWLYDPVPHASPRPTVRRRMGDVAAVVVFTRGLEPQGGQEVRYLECGRGVRLVYLPIEAGEILVLSDNTYYTSREPE
jgi:hypothetical protein